MKIPFMAENAPDGFEAPTALPADSRQATEWQGHNRSWWEKHPMRYDWGGALAIEELTPAFFSEIDRRFLKTAWEEYPWRSVPFDGFIDFPSLANRSVLEIGVGCGTHAQLLAARCGDYMGIDLTDYAVRATTERFRQGGLKGRIVRMDAESMTFADHSFDFVWSWGVIHHSSNTSRILSEIARVLKPGGRCTVMVYHRSVWNFLIRGLLYYGVLRGGLFRTRSVHKLIQEATDGALARYYTIDEWRGLVTPLFRVDRVTVLGHRTQLVPLPWGALKERIGGLIPVGVGRWITNRPFFGYMLVAEMTKAGKQSCLL